MTRSNPEHRTDEALAEQVADAVLYEGYVLYPYRASAAKNRFRWQVGLVTPRDYAEATAADPWVMQTECLAEVRDGATLTVRVRGLHVQERRIEQRAGRGSAEWRVVSSTVIMGRQLLAWEEAVPAEFTRGGLPLEGELRKSCCPWHLGESCEIERVLDDAGRTAARIVRTRAALEIGVRIESEPYGTLRKIRVRIENLTRSAARSLAERPSALRQSLAGTHTVLTIDNGAFVSLLDPPPELDAAAASCENLHTFPVLVGSVGSRTVMLSSPVILYDYPAVAPESAGEFCDATEIDELLMLRIRTLTEDEKREARATDARAAAIIDGCEGASTAAIGRLHGAVRALGDAPESAGVEVDGVRIGCGSRVRLRPARASDSLDLCIQGRTATVAAVYRTLEDTPYVAVTLDDDPLGQLDARYRRALFFRPDELEAWPGDAGGRP